MLSPDGEKALFDIVGEDIILPKNAQKPPELCIFSSVGRGLAPAVRDKPEFIELIYLVPNSTVIIRNKTCEVKSHYKISWIVLRAVSAEFRSRIPFGSI